MTGKNLFGKFDVNEKEIMDTENAPKTFAIGLWSYCAVMLIISKCNVSADLTFLTGIQFFFRYKETLSSQGLLSSFFKSSI